MCQCIFFCSQIALNAVTLVSCFFVTEEITGILAQIATRTDILRAEAEWSTQLSAPIQCSDAISSPGASEVFLAEFDLMGHASFSQQLIR
jgi:hypothetical protein